MRNSMEAGKIQFSRIPVDGRAITEVMEVPPKAMKIYVKVDMEGISGIVSPDQIEPGNPEYEPARRMLMRDLGAVLIGAFRAGCSEVLIYDTHSKGRNLDLSALDDRASVIAGKPEPTSNFFYGLDSSFAALFLVGFHARAGTAEALMPHTYDNRIVSFKVNDKELGEIGVEAALAGEFGVPLVFVSADSAAVKEARELVGDEVETVEVKQAINETSCLCLPASKTTQMLEEAATRAVCKARSMPPLLFQSPTTIDVTFRTSKGVPALAKRAGVERTGQKSIRTQGQNVLAAYRCFAAARQGNGAA